MNESWQTAVSNSVKVKACCCLSMHDANYILIYTDCNKKEEPILSFMITNNLVKCSVFNSRIAGVSNTKNVRVHVCVRLSCFNPSKTGKIYEIK